ncbi:MAG: hypothetical protein ACP5HG_09140 [Anaerolineae bacterium]
MIRRLSAIAALTLSLAMLAVGCVGTLELQVETTPGPEATITALEAKAADLSTRVAVAEPSPTPVVGQGQLAYVRGGDILIKTLPDGVTQRLTDDGRNSSPLWSPSGRWLAYLKDTALWTVAPGKGPPHLLGDPVNQVAWSPVEDRLAYIIGSGTLRLIVVDPDGAHERVLLPPAGETTQGQVTRMAWSPDGAWIAYQWSQGREAQGLWKIPADGGEPITLYDSGVPDRGDALLAGWTADSAYLLFWQGEILSASMLADGAPVYALPMKGGEPVELVNAVLYHPDFVSPAPGEARVALIQGGGRGTWWNKALRVVELHGGAVEVLSVTTTSNQAASSPSWSPEGERIAYVAMPDRGDLVGGDDAIEGLMARRLWVTDINRGEPHPLTDNGPYRDEFPLWSTDGRHLLFVRMDSEGAASLWWMDVDGGQPVRVTEELGPIPGPADPRFGYYGHVSWEPLFHWWRGGSEGALVSAPTGDPPSGGAPDPLPNPGERADEVEDPAFPNAQAMLAAYQHPPAEASPVVEALARDCARWLSEGGDPEALGDALRGLPKLESANPAVTLVDLNGDGLSDVVVEPRFIGLAVLGCLTAQDGTYTCQPLPAPATFGDYALTMQSGILSQDLIGDGRPETVVTYTLQGGSGWRELLYVFRWTQPTWSEQVFRATLINWAGASEWHLERDPTSRQRSQIVLTYPQLYPIDHKMLNHPLGRQIWRWDGEAGRFSLTERTVDLAQSAWGPEMEITPEDRLRWLTNAGEVAFRRAEYEEAVDGYDEALAYAETQDWRPADDEPDWIGFLRFRRAQVLAYLGQTEAARTGMQRLATDYEDDLLGELAAAFLAGYGDSSREDAPAEAHAALLPLEERLRDHFYNERPGALRFPLQADHMLCCEPGSRAAAAYDGASWPQVGGLFEAGP